MIHILEGDWAICGQSLAIDCSRIYSWVKIKNLEPQVINIDEIGYKPTSTIEKQDSRYVNADIDLPGIVVKGMQNPDKKPYRMMDGRHRLLKAKNSGKSVLLVYVLEEKQALKFIV